MRRTGGLALGTGIAAFVLYLGFMFVPMAAANLEIPFPSLPALYEVSEDLAAKRGTELDTTPNRRIYVRLGWNSCVRITISEIKDLYRDDLETDRYINLRDLAVSNLEEGEWDDVDRANCPPEPKVVQHRWFGSRPTYVPVYDESIDRWVRGPESGYRVRAPRTDPEPCGTYRVANKDLTASDYHALDAAAEVYDRDGVYKVGDLNMTLLAVCEGSGIPVTEYRF